MLSLAFVVRAVSFFVGVPGILRFALSSACPQTAHNRPSAATGNLLPPSRSVNA